jgi:hypothetical protein
MTYRIDLLLAAERHEGRSHAGAWERGFFCLLKCLGSLAE